MLHSRSCPFGSSHGLSETMGRATTRRAEPHRPAPRPGRDVFGNLPSCFVTSHFAGVLPKREDEELKPLSLPPLPPAPGGVARNEPGWVLPWRSPISSPAGRDRAPRRVARREGLRRSVSSESSPLGRTRSASGVGGQLGGAATLARHQCRLSDLLGTRRGRSWGGLRERVREDVDAQGPAQAAEGVGKAGLNGPLRHFQDGGAFAVGQFLQLM